MSIVTRCPYCRRGVRVPDRARGESLKCPACQAWYTVFPENDPKAGEKRKRRDESSPTAPKVAPTPVAEAKPVPAEVGAETAVATTAPTVESAPAADPAAEPIPSLTVFTDAAARPSSSPQQEGKSQLHPLGVVACLLGGLGLLAASFQSVALLTRPLAGLGLLLGIVAWVNAAGGKPVRLVFPIAGSVVSGLVLLFAFLNPAMIGERYEISRQHSDYDPDAIKVIPLQLTGGRDGLEIDGYADAGRTALQQGFVRVQVTGAVIGPVQVVDSKKRFTKQPLLAVGVRIQHLGHGPQVRFVHWGTSGERTVPAATATVNGRKLAPGSAEPDTPAGVTYGHDLFPTREVDDLLLFEPPVGSPVRLELPAEAWGGRGVFRFQLPGSMVVTQAVPKPR